MPLVVPVRPAGRVVRLIARARPTILGIVGRDGAFAEYLVLPEENLHQVPKEIDTAAATFVEPLAAALAIQQQVTIRPDDRCFYSVTASWGNLSRRPWP